MDNWIGRIFMIALSIFYVVLSVLGIVWIVDFIKEHKASKKEV